MQLNKQQKAAVTCKDNYVLVISGAGSGKTTVLTHRVAYLVKKGVDPERILLLTFTNKAAREMIKRSSDLLGKNVEIEGGTFHSFAYKNILRFRKFLGFKKLSVLDTQDSKDLIGLLSKDYREKYSNFPKKDMIYNIFSKSNRLDKPVSEISKQYGIELDTLYKEYVKYKKKHGLLTFDDMLIYFLKLLENKKIRDRISFKYKYVLVDEYQDTNYQQMLICKYLSSYHKNLMVVGDDDQSIFSFRGANYKNIIDFSSDLKCKIIKIEENYRSSQKILNFTNKVINQAKSRYSKNLYSSNIGEYEPLFIRPVDFIDEAIHIASRLKKGDAVLFRSSYSSTYLEAELHKRKISFVKYGGIQFVEKSHVKDVLAFLRSYTNYNDVVAWSRILTLIPGVGSKTSQYIINNIIEKESIFKGLRIKGKKYSESLKDLFFLFKMKNLSIKDKIKRINKFYKPFMNKLFSSDSLEKRYKDLKVLEEIATDYKSDRKFLVDLTLDPSKDKKEGDIVLSTIHSAKGLEWDTVYILSLIKDFIPSKYATTEDSIEEERRLFYVAATRSKKKLVLSCPTLGNVYKEDFGEESNVSIFLKEIYPFDFKKEKCFENQ